MSRDVVEDLEPETREMCRLLLARAEGIPTHSIVVTQTLRTWGEQDILYRQGRSTPGKIVTYAKAGYSWHNFGRAFDICFRALATGAITYEGPWEFMGELGEQIGLEWGGRWSHPDRDHFEHRGGMTLAQARASRPRSTPESPVTT